MRYGRVCTKTKRRRDGVRYRDEALLSYIKILPNASSFLLPIIHHSDLIEIKFKKRKEREEEKKKGSSSLHGDLVQILSDLCERVCTVIFFFKIWKKRSWSKDEEPDLQGASTPVILMFQSDSSIWISVEIGHVHGYDQNPRHSQDLRYGDLISDLFF